MIKDSIEHDGFKLRYHIEGEGMPVLVCGSALYYERCFPKQLTKHCQMIYFDNRVFGGTCQKKATQADFELEKIYTEVYRLRNQYAAAFMRPYRFDRTRPNQPVYYSLRQPTALEFSPRARKVASTMSDLHEVKHVLKTVMKDFSERRDLVGTPLSEFARLSEINFYHTEKDALSEALPVGGLATADPAFPVLFERQKGLKLCESSPFLKGCVTIAAKDLSDDQE